MISIALLLLASPNLQNQIDLYVRAAAARKEFSGVVLVERGDAVIYRKAVGDASFELDVKNRPDTIFRIASVSKTFTAAAIYLLEKRGKLSFNDRLNRYLKSFPKANEITIQQLLEHTSGVGTPDLEIWTHREPSLDQVIDLIAKTPFRFEPGKGSAYSGSGYTILAKVIEVVSGRSYDDFLQREFFKPLGMTHTGSFVQAQFVRGRAAPYMPGPPPAGVEPVGGFDELCYVGAGSLWSTADDLGKWLRAIESNRFFNLDRLSWPMGWGKRTYFGRRANEQTGISTGFTSAVTVFPGSHLRVVILSNIQSQFTNKAIVDIPGIVFGVQPKPTSVPTLRPIPRIRPHDFIGKYKTEGDDTMDIILRRGHLYYRWNGSSDYRYLAPVTSKSLYAPDESALWTWSPTGFSWNGPFGSFKLIRQ